MSESDLHLDSIVELAGQLASLNDRAILIYRPIVDDLVGVGSADSHLIETALDGLLGFAGSVEGLRLYKKLCRHYWDVDSVATASYVQAYREMWEDDSVSS